MRDRKITYQKLGRGFKDKYALALKYYEILSIINDLKMTERETQLVAYTAVRGNITFGNIRDDFCREFNSSIATVNNIVSRMKEIGVMMKVDGKNVINPAILVNFEEDIVLQINLRYDNK